MISGLFVVTDHREMVRWAKTVFASGDSSQDPSVRAPEKGLTAHHSFHKQEFHNRSVAVSLRSKEVEYPLNSNNC